MHVPADPAPDRPAGPDRSDGPGIDVTEHPARRFVLLIVVLTVVGTIALLADRGARDPRSALLPYLGERASLQFRSGEAGAGETVEMLDGVVLVAVEDLEGIAVLRVELDMHDPDGTAARIPIPLDRLIEVWVGPLRIYRAPDRG